MRKNPLLDNLRFLRALVARPKSVGAIAPSGPQLARAMARQIGADVDGPVLELGPGTGVITEAILAHGVAPERITAIEYDEVFAHRLALRFPRLEVVHGDAFALERTLGNRAPFAAILSGLPLLNFPPASRRALMDGVRALLRPHAPFVQFSYGLAPPVAPPEGFDVTRAALVWRNIPPARVWVYRRA